MAKGRRTTPEYQTRIVTPSVSSGWVKQGIVLKSMYHAYNKSGKIGDIVDVDNDLYDELIKKGFIKAI